MFFTFFFFSFFPFSSFFFSLPPAAPPFFVLLHRRGPFSCPDRVRDERVSTARRSCRCPVSRRVMAKSMLRDGRQGPGDLIWVLRPPLLSRPMAGPKTADLGRNTRGESHLRFGGWAKLRSARREAKPVCRVVICMVPTQIPASLGATLLLCAGAEGLGLLFWAHATMLFGFVGTSDGRRRHIFASWPMATTADGSSEKCTLASSETRRRLDPEKTLCSLYLDASNAGELSVGAGR